MNRQQRYHRVGELFRAACELPPAERPGFLDAQCEGDETLKNEVLDLLAEDDSSTGILQHPPLGEQVHLSQVVAAVGSGSSAMPESIGRYQVIRKLGAGGMGVVYEARQESPRRTVALKIINAGVATPGMIRRFEHEAEVLGRLQHPGIAQIFEAGLFDAGAGAQQFFAMELIKGEPITRYAAAHALDTRQRLELIAKTCDAVNHAHQRGVIHRDLKPGNILVDETGQPKILDFGVARATDGDLQTATLRTQIGELVGTIPYMSPEQAAGDPSELDTRSDVYAMGVVAFQLLANRLPYEVGDRMVHEAVRVIREEEPTRLSAIQRSFRGDVETIVAKALEKEKGRRYQSAAELAADIRRHLNDEPIIAQPASTLYQLRKFARRNKTLVGGVVAVFLVLTAGIVTTSWGLALAIAANEKETVQREIAEAVNTFLNEDLLAATDPYNTRDRDITMRQVLDNAAENIEGRFDGRPLVEAAIRRTLGNTYQNLGEYEPAERHLAAALELRRSVLTSEHEDTLESMYGLALVHYWAGDYDRAEAILLEALEVAPRVLDDEHPLSLKLEGIQGQVYEDQSRFDEAEAIYSRNHEACLRVHGPDHAETLTAKARLASVYSRQGRFDEAIPLGKEIIDRRRHVLGEDHPDTIGALNNLGSTYTKAGRWAEAEPVLAEALDLMTRVMGPEHAHTMACTRNLAQVYERQQRYEDAERLLLRAYQTDLRNLGQEHPGTLKSMNDLARVYRSQGRLDEAEPLMRKAVEVSRRVRGDQHSHTIVYTSTLASIRFHQEQYEDAAALYESAIAAKRLAFPDGHWHIGAFLNGLGQCYTTMKSYPEAEAALLEAHAILDDAFGPTSVRTVAVINAQVDLYDAWDKPSKVAEYQALLPDKN